jgi:hypothetical protein
MTKQQLIEHLANKMLEYATVTENDKDQYLYEEGVRKGLALAIVNLQKLDEDE